MDLNGSVSAPPPALRARVLAAATDRRAAGAPIVPGLAGEATPVDAFAAQVADLLDLLESLGPDEWAAPTPTGWTAHELVGHLVGVEEYLGAELGLWPFTTSVDVRHDHVAVTLDAVAAQRHRAPADTIRAWRSRAAAIVDHVARLDDEALARRLPFHGVEMSLRSILGARTFEVWAHGDDIRSATGRPLQAPSPDRLRLMSNLAVRALPLGMLLAGLDRPGRTVRLVLTGPGGGTWDQALGLGEEADTPDVSIVADVVSFCRLAARRLPLEELAFDAEGEESLAYDVLVGAQVFAA